MSIFRSSNIGMRILIFWTPWTVILLGICISGTHNGEEWLWWLKTSGIRRPSGLILFLTGFRIWVWRRASTGLLEDVTPLGRKEKRGGILDSGSTRNFLAFFVLPLGLSPPYVRSHRFFSLTIHPTTDYMLLVLGQWSAEGFTMFCYLFLIRERGMSSAPA